MNLRHLEYFAAVTRRGTFSGASTETGVSQSALSQAVSALESQVGAALFERSSGGVRLTSAGREFLPHAEEALAALSRAREAVTRVSRLEGGHLAIACPASLGIDPLPRLVAAFRREFPQVAVRIHDVPEHRVNERDLFDLNADIVVTFADLVSPADLHTVQLAPIELFAVLQADDNDPVTLTDLVAHGLVTTPADTATHRFMTSALGLEALQAAIAVQVTHPEGVLPLVLNGAGATVLPAGHARVAAAMPGLARCPLNPPASFEVAAAIPRSSQSIAAHHFLRVCQETR